MKTYLWFYFSCSKRKIVCIYHFSCFLRNLHIVVCIIWHNKKMISLWSYLITMYAPVYVLCLGLKTPYLAYVTHYFKYIEESGSEWWLLRLYKTIIYVMTIQLELFVVWKALFCYFIISLHNIYCFHHMLYLILFSLLFIFFLYRLVILKRHYHL